MKPKETRMYLNGIIASEGFMDYAARVSELCRMDVDANFLEIFEEYHRTAGKSEHPAFNRVVHSGLDGIISVTDTYTNDCWNGGHHPQNIRAYDFQQGDLTLSSNKNRFMPPGR